MKTCEACAVRVQTESNFCPLCGEPLAPGEAPPYALPGGEYPNLQRQYAQYNVVLRILLFVTLLGCGLSVLINWLVTPQLWWSLIVLAAALYCWLTVPPLLRRGVNYGAQVVAQVILTSGLVVGVDFFTGYRGWSTSFVIPGLLCAGLLAIGTMVVFNRTNWTQYVLFQVIMGVFGFVPLVLYLTGIAHNLVLVLVTAALALASLLVTIVFGDRSIKSEFRRRFHL